jgi:hypothetical protein
MHRHAKGNAFKLLVLPNLDRDKTCSWAGAATLL